MKKTVKIVIVVAIIGLGFLAVIYGELLYKEISVKNSLATEIERDAKWEITGASYEEGQFRLKLGNKNGQLREYTGVLAYSLAFNNENLAFLNIEYKLVLVNLNTEEQVLSENDFAPYKLNYNNALGWNKASTLVSFIGNIELSSEILIFNLRGINVTTIKSEGYFEDSKVLFDPFAKPEDERVLVRTVSPADFSLKKEDGSLYKPEELPIFLTIYSLEEKILYSFRITDTLPSSGLFYRWNPSLPDYIEYNFSNSALFPLNVIKL